MTWCIFVLPSWKTAVLDITQYLARGQNKRLHEPPHGLPIVRKLTRDLQNTRWWCSAVHNYHIFFHTKRVGMANFSEFWATWKIAMKSVYMPPLHGDLQLRGIKCSSQMMLAFLSWYLHRPWSFGSCILLLWFCIHLDAVHNYHKFFHIQKSWHGKF